MNLVLKRLYIFLTVAGGFWLVSGAGAEVTEVVTHYPMGDVEFDRLHANRATIGDAYQPAVVPDASVPNGNLFIAGRLGIGTPVPGRTVDVFAVNGARFAGSAGFENGVYFTPSSINTGLSGLAIGYNQTYNGTAMTNAGFLQAETQGGAYRNLLLNPLGGSIGVGTTSPATLLHVRDLTGGNRPTLLVERSSGGTAPPRLGLIDLDEGGGAVTTSPIWSIENLQDRFRITRKANITAAATEHFMMTNAGRIGLGTAIPSAMLDILTTTIGTVAVWADGNTPSANGLYALGPWNATVISCLGPNSYGSYGNGQEVGVFGNGEIATSGAGIHAVSEGSGAYIAGSVIGFSAWTDHATGIALDVTAANDTGILADGQDEDFYASGPGIDYGSPSSIRWKRNIHPLEGVSEKLLRIRGVYFRWDKPHGGRQDLGLIAEEVGRIFPEIVHYEPDGKKAVSVEYSRMTPLLVEAVKELEKRIKALEEEASSLKGKTP
ncbi:MAG: tail fiber domain-containing protein [Candidatus Omnitrophica bacterium]|nr:tail fiber domain-containing protein [Candidatus Omnitrophota bacterium]